MVVMRSAADTPVLTPVRASIDTVNAVPYWLRLSSTIGRRPSDALFSAVRHRQTMPLHSRISMAMLACVSLSAATMRSASFSRSASSSTTTGTPSRAASSAAAMRAGMSAGSKRASMASRIPLLVGNAGG